MASELCCGKKQTFFRCNINLIEIEIAAVKAEINNGNKYINADSSSATALSRCCLGFGFGILKSGSRTLPWKIVYDMKLNKKKYHSSFYDHNNFVLRKLFSECFRSFAAFVRKSATKKKKTSPGLKCDAINLVSRKSRFDVWRGFWNFTTTTCCAFGFCAC